MFLCEPHFYTDLIHGDRIVRIENNKRTCDEELAYSQLKIIYSFTVILCDNNLEFKIVWDKNISFIFLITVR